LHPGNVFVAGEAAVLVDGLPVTVIGEPTLKQIHYNAPEVIRGDEYSFASEL
jgi:hypothetical protein